MCADIRLTICPLHREDLPVIWDLLNHPKVIETCDVPKPFTWIQAENWFSRIVISIEKGDLTSLIVRAEGVICGMVCVSALGLPSRVAEVDYWIAPPFQERGIGTWTVHQGIASATKSGYTTLFSSCLGNNFASIRVLEKNGFVRTRRWTVSAGSGVKFGGREMLRFRRDRYPGLQLIVVDPLFIPGRITAGTV